MRDRVLILLIVLLAAVNLTAQERFYPDHPKDDAARYEGPVYGIKGGVNVSRFYYTSQALSGLTHTDTLSLSAGCFLELPLSRTFTIAMELNYQQRGGATTYQFNGKPERYSLLAHYVTARVPVYCYIPVTDHVKPYVFLAPEVGAPVAGEIRLQGGYYNGSTPISNANINRLYVGALGGVGLRFNIPMRTITMVLKLDAALNIGLLDTYSLSERSGIAHPLNLQAYTIDGHRYLRGLEGHLTLGFFINKPDACVW